MLLHVKVCFLVKIVCELKCGEGSELTRGKERKKANDGKKFCNAAAAAQLISLTP